MLVQWNPLNPSLLNAAIRFNQSLLQVQNLYELYNLELFTPVNTASSLMQPL